MKATDLKAGTKIQFSNGKIIEIHKATETRLSWYTGFNFRGGNGINKMKMTWITLNLAQTALDNNDWKVLN